MGGQGQRSRTACSSSPAACSPSAVSTLRCSAIVPARGRHPEHTFVFLRAHGLDRVLVAVNFGQTPAEVTIEGRTGLLASTHSGRARLRPPAGTLRAHEGVVLELLS